MAKKIGELLVEHRLISDDQLAEATTEQKKSGERLGTILIRKGYVTAEDLEFLLSRQHSVAAINLEKYRPAADVVSLVPEKFMKKHFVLPVEVHNKTLSVAMANPHDYKVLDELRFMTGLRVAPLVSSMYGIKAKLRELFPASVKWEEVLETPAPRDLEIIQSQPPPKEENLEETIQSASEAPVIRMVNSIILAALAKRATHVHVIPRDDVLDVRIRVNGLLEPLITPPRELSQNLVNRIKVLAGIDVLQRRTPQEGFLRVKSEDQYFDVDVSTFPMRRLEQVVLAFQQLFSKEELHLENLGMGPEVLPRFVETIRGRRGLVLVVGPHDSGKTSTLYAAMNSLKNPKKASVTYENPIKNKLWEINQAEPNEKSGLTYVSGLKALIKQDLDYLMVGDISNQMVLATAVEAALGKTLVFSRMVYNNTVGVIPQLIEQGVPPFSLYSALTAILGQRLVRRLCPYCLESFDPPAPIQDEIQKVTGKERIVLYRATGCARCNLTGYSGRIGIFELLVLNEEVRNQIVTGAPLDVLRESAKRAGLRPMIEDGLTKAIDGITTYEEVMGEGGNK